MRAHFTLLLASVVTLAACGDDSGIGPMIDAGPMGDGGGRDAGRQDAGRQDAGGEDAGTDAGSEDAGVEPRSRVTVRLESGPMTFDAEDGSGNGIVLTAGAALGTAAGENVVVTSGSDAYVLDVAMLDFDGPLALEDPEGNSVAPDEMFSGSFMGAPVFVGTFGTDLRIFDFAATAFSAPLAIVELTDPTAGTVAPLDPTYVAIVDLMGNGNGAAVALGSDGAIYLMDASLRFVKAIAEPATCMGGTPVRASIIVGAVLPDIGAASGDTVLLVEDDQAYPVTASLCLGEAVDLVDQTGAPIEPQFAFGADFDGDGDDELVMVHE